MELLVDISKKFQGFTLNVSFSTGKETLGILGASGSGKSMTLRCIAGLVTPDKGKIVLNGRVLFDSDKGINLPAKKRNVGYLFQDYALFPNMTVAQNIAFGLDSYSSEEKDRIISEKVTMLQLTGLEERYPFQLSGGQQQRVALARALAIEPEVLLLDEPFSALDNYLRSEMERELIESLLNYNGITLFVTHNLEECYRVCKNLIVMEKGKAVAGGSKETIFLKPPTVSVAQLTGCKNISKSRVISSDRIEAIDWGCDLLASQAIPCNLTHVGIRAHHLTFVEDAGLVNSFPGWIANVIETPYKVNLYLSLNKPPSNPGDYHLQAEMYKEKFDLIKNRPFPWWVRLAPEQLFLTTEN